MAKHNYHDKGYRALLSKKRNFMQFLRHFVKHSWVDLIDEDTLELRDTEFVSKFFDKMMSDLIYSVKIADREVYFFVLTELQSTPDNTMPYRIFEYMAAILSRAFNDTPKDVRERRGFRLPVVVPIVFYNGSSGWVVTERFRDYLQDDGLFKDVNIIDFEYTLVDINLLDREYLLSNHDAICATLAVDTVRDDGLDALIKTLTSIKLSKQEFRSEDYSDFVSWFVNTVSHRTVSEHEAASVVGILMEGEDDEMGIGLGSILDKAVDKGKAKVALNMLRNGYDKETVAELTEMSVEWVEGVLTDESLVS